nr:MAG TPA: hypothetical protein [Caudoviricetes sp.]
MTVFVSCTVSRRTCGDGPSRLLTHLKAITSLLSAH